MRKTIINTVLAATALGSFVMAVRANGMQFLMWLIILIAAVIILIDRNTNWFKEV